MKSITFALQAAACLSLLTSIAFAETVSLEIVSWNVESGQAQPRTIAEGLAALDGVDLWGLSEVQSDQVAQSFEESAEEGEDANSDGQQDDFGRITGTTGAADRLSIIFNTARLELVDSFELHDVNPGNFRSPLVAHFKGLRTGKEFLFMVNHLARGRADVRHDQATKLNQWAREQELPVIAVGDYNFDWDVNSGDNKRNRDLGFDNLTTDAIFTWVRPPHLVATQTDPRFDSVLDFVFTAGQAFGWAGESEIIVDDRFSGPPTDLSKSDHRPVRARFSLLEETPAPLVSVAGRGEREPSDESPRSRTRTMRAREGRAPATEASRPREALEERLEKLEAEVKALRDRLPDR